MGGSHSPSRSPATFNSLKPNEHLDEIFLTRQQSPAAFRRWLPSWLLGFNSSSSLGSLHYPPDSSTTLINRIARVQRVYWCSDPLNEVGGLRILSPRTLNRWLAFRQSRGLVGPASWEIGHSYAIVDVDIEPALALDGRYVQERYRLNWGQGIKFGTNVTMTKQDTIPPRQILGERLEDDRLGTCSGEELRSFLKKWDGRPYDAAPTNNSNCHNFVQELIHQCTDKQGYGQGDR